MCKYYEPEFNNLLFSMLKPTYQDYPRRLETSVLTLYWCQYQCENRTPPRCHRTVSSPGLIDLWTKLWRNLQIIVFTARIKNHAKANIVCVKACKHGKRNKQMFWLKRQGGFTIKNLSKTDNVDDKLYTLPKILKIVLKNMWICIWPMTQFYVIAAYITQIHVISHEEVLRTISWYS